MRRYAGPSYHSRDELMPKSNGRIADLASDHRRLGDAAHTASGRSRGPARSRLKRVN